jgi:hypothetical protein
MLKLSGVWLCGLSSVPQGSGLSRLRSSITRRRGGMTTLHCESLSVSLSKRERYSRMDSALRWTSLKRDNREAKVLETVLSQQCWVSAASISKPRP